jgi:hypothetical protein
VDLRAAPIVLAIWMILAAATWCAAQPAPPPTPKVSGAGARPQPTLSVSTNPERIKRWFEVDAFSISSRYRLIRNAAGVTTTNQLQWQLAGRGKFKIDNKGRYSVNFGLFTGNVINGGWNNTGAGTGHPQSNLYLKHLFFAAKPVKWLEGQIGSFGVNNGENTEIIGYDNDVYIIGERIRIRAPKQAYFDEISYTSGFVGDLTRPSVFRRLGHLNNWNYHQLLVRKRLNKRVGFSADYAYERPSHTLRQAVRIGVAESRVLDTVLFENYQRVHPDEGYGVNLSGEKAVNKRFTVGGGFARIDRPVLNADRFPPGKRLYITSSYKISREITLSTALIQAVGHLPTPQTPHTRVEAIISYNILETLRKLKVQ